MDPEEQHAHASDRTTGNVVVVGVDGTEDGKRALRYATALAVRDDTELRLVHIAQEAVMYAPMLPYIPWETFAEIGNRVLEKSAEQVREWGWTGDLTRVLGRGPRAAAFLEHLEGAHCVVLGTRSSEVQHLFTGSTTTSLGAHSPVPVFGVPRAWSPDQPTRNRVVVGIDSAEDVGEVLDVAFAEALARDAEVHVVHAWRPTGYYDAAISARTLEPQWREHGGPPLRKVIEESARTVPGARWFLTMDFDRPVVALHHAAGQADLLVLARRGHRTPFGLHIGSTTRTMLRTAPCPVLVVPITHQDEGRH